METAWLVPGTPACCMPTAGEEDGREGFAPTCCGTTTECYHWPRKLQDMQSRNDYKVRVWFRWSQPSKLKPKFWSKPPQNLLASTVYDLVCDCSTEIGPSKSQSQRRQIQLTQEVVSEVVTITIKRQTWTYSVSFAIPVNMLMNLRSQMCLRNRNTCAIWVVHSGKCGWHMAAQARHLQGPSKGREHHVSTNTHKHHCNHLNPSPTNPDADWHVQWRYWNFI